MGKLILLMHVSLDGYVAKSNGEINWITFDDELSNYVTELRGNVDATLYGRNTYQMMEGYWPSVLTDPKSQKSELDYAQWVDKTLKVAVSATLPGVTWNNTRLIKNHLSEEIIRLKQELKGDILLIGSAQLTHSLFGMGLIDEFRINVNPVVLGSGIPLFKDVKAPVKLDLVDIRKFKCGVAGLYYKNSQ